MKLLIFILALYSEISFSKSIVGTVNNGKSCQLSQLDKNQFNCEYKAGDSLSIVIERIGTQHPIVVFVKSDPAYVAQYYIEYNCVKVSYPKEMTWAFINPKNGKVYSDGENCKVGN